MNKKKLEKPGRETNWETIDEWLRLHLKASPKQVDRVVRGALDAERSAPALKRIPWWRTAVVVSAALALLAVMLVLFIPERSRLPGPTLHRNGSRGIVATITNQSGQVELRLHPVPGVGFPVDRERGSTTEPSATIFNQDGLVVARVTNGDVRYLMIGGNL